MMSTSRNTAAAAILMCFALAGCNAHMPIVALAVDEVGVVAGAAPQSQGVALTVGYKGAKFAILPVESERGRLLALKTAKGQETYSIFTQLGLDARAGTAGGSVGVEQVLAVGPAAKVWASRASPIPEALTPPTPPGQ